ncbi:MAG: hypothetical protein WCI77_08020 [Candidatus Omnitrophota bacterium]
MNKLEDLLLKRKKAADSFKAAGLKDIFSFDALHDLILLTITESRSNQERLEKILSSLAVIVTAVEERKDIIEHARKVLEVNASGEVKVLSGEIRVNNLEEIKIPEEVSVKNLKDIRIPDEVSIKKPNWYKEFDNTWLGKELNNITDLLIKGFNKLSQKIFVDNKEPKDAIPVRLVAPDGKTFYKAEGGRGSGGMFISENGLSYGKALKKITPISVDDGTPAVYELPKTEKYLAIQNKGSSIVAFGDADVTYSDYPTLTPRQFYEFVDCKQGFKIYFKCDTGKTATIVGFTR